MVWMRASERRSRRKVLTASTSPSASLKLRRNRDSFKRAASSCNSSSDISCSLSNSSRRFITLDRAPFLIAAAHKLRLDRQLLRRQPHRLARRRLVHTFDLVEDAPRFDDRDPVFGRALAFAHARLGGLLSD